MKPKPSGSSKKSSGQSYKNADTTDYKDRDRLFREFGNWLNAKDAAAGRNRAAAAKQRQTGLKNYVSAVGAAGVASGYGTVGKKKSSVKSTAIKKAQKKVGKI